MSVGQYASLRVYVCGVTTFYTLVCILSFYFFLCCTSYDNLSSSLYTREPFGVYPTSSPPLSSQWSPCVGPGGPSWGSLAHWASATAKGPKQGGASRGRLQPSSGGAATAFYGRGGPRERVKLSPLGGSGAKRTLARRGGARLLC